MFTCLTSNLRGKQERCPLAKSSAERSTSLESPLHTRSRFITTCINQGLASLSPCNTDLSSLPGPRLFISISRSSSAAFAGTLIPSAGCLRGTTAAECSKLAQQPPCRRGPRREFFLHRCRLGPSPSAEGYSLLCSTLHPPPFPDVAMFFTEKHWTSSVPNFRVRTRHSECLILMWPSRFLKLVLSDKFLGQALLELEVRSLATNTNREIQHGSSDAAPLHVRNPNVPCPPGKGEGKSHQPQKFTCPQSGGGRSTG